MLYMADNTVCFRWGDGDKPQKDGKAPVFHHFQIFRDDGYGDNFIGETSAYAYYDNTVVGGFVYAYSVYGVIQDPITKAELSYTPVFYESFTVPAQKPVVESTADGFGTIVPPIEYKITPKKGKLRHAWRTTASASGERIVGVFIEDDETGHAAAFIPAESSCSSYWDQPIKGYHCFRLRTLDEAANLSDPTEWVCSAPDSSCTGGTVGSGFRMYDGIIYGTVTIGANFSAGNPLQKTGGSDVVGWGATVGNDVVFEKGVTVGEIARIEDDQTILADTVIPYNGKVP